MRGLGQHFNNAKAESTSFPKASKNCGMKRISKFGRCHIGTLLGLCLRGNLCPRRVSSSPTKPLSSDWRTSNACNVVGKVGFEPPMCPWLATAISFVKAKKGDIQLITSPQTPASLPLLAHIHPPILTPHGLSEKA